MKQKLENVMRNKKVMIALMEILIAIGCIVIFYLLMSSNNRAKETTYSYSKVEEVTEYRVVDNYITRVEPLTSYETFKEIAENTLNNASDNVQYTVKVYSDAEKTEEVTSGYIASGMVVEALEKVDEITGEEVVEESEELPVEESTEMIYTVSVLGDMTKDGDISITELTKLIKGVVGLTDWSFTEEEKLAADISGDNEINVVDIELCINYIVFGKLDFEEATFTVTFKDYDGRVISSKKDYHYGDTIEIPEEPTREADEIYTYEFAGWAPVISERVTKDEVYVATYRSIEIATESVYKVEHYKETIEGAYELAETEELVGKIGEEVTAISKEYTGFSENVENEDRISAGTVLEDGSLVLKLYYDRNTYTVTFKDEDGTILDTKTYKYEETVEVPENPTKAEDNTYTYEFAGWTPEVEETVTGDAEYTATYEGINKEYTVVFKNEDGSVVNSTVYHYGDIVEIPENPSKAEDNTYRYEFAGWTPEVQETVTGDAEYTATYTSVYKEYTVVFKNDDGSVIISGNYHYGDTVEIPENPTKEADETYLYEFAGWTPVVKDIVTENAEYTATYKIIYREYTVEFKNDDGSLITSKVYHYGDTVEVPGNPRKAEDNTYTYEFAGWSPEVKEIVTENAEYIATYTNIYKEYTIVFKNDDGTELSKKIYHYGDRVEIPENPTKAADETYTYEFAGWSPEVEETVKGNAEYIATYTNTNIEYIIVFKNYDGTELSRKTYHYGDTVEIPENPTKAEDETYTYEFDGWTPEVEETVKGNAEYTATFRNIYKEYTIVFKNDDGTEISSKVYHYGDTVEIPENPTKEADETYTYEFAGWTPEVAETVTGNAEYTATYTNTNIEYTIVFKNEDGTEISSKVYHYGDTVELPENPSKAEDNTYTYEFAGWTPEVEETVKGDAEYTATFRSIYKEYTIVFKNEDGTEVSSKAYHYGDTVEVPENPTKAEDETYTYEFSGWTPEVSETVVGNAEHTATYEGIYKEYTIVFRNDNGTELSTNTYHYGDTVEVPENPSKAEDETYTYEFAGWTPEASETVVGNAEYTATYEGTYKEYTIEFKNYDGTVLSTKTYHYGDAIEVPENPTKVEDETYTYEFAGWDKEITSVKEDRTYVATYTAIYKEYVVTFKQDNGMVINSTVYHYGDTVEIPEDPVKESTIEYAYKFTGWTPEVEETITEDVEYSATYQAIKIDYTFIFYNDDGITEIARIENYNYGDNVTFPSTPSKEPTEEINYKFDAWKTVGTEQISDTQINIKFVAQYTEEYFVARVLETETLEGASYMSLQEAIYATGEEKRTIKLLLDTEESILVDDVQDITIDLNGKTITGSKTETKAYAVKNYGTLEITDTTEAKSGKIQESARETVGYGIYNREGKLTIQAGMIVTDTDKESGSTYAIYNQSEESVLINGGTISAEAKGESSSSYGIYNLSGKEIIVSGGTILGNASAEKAKGYGIYNATDGSINVTGGTIKGATSLASAVSYGIYNTISENVTISGGIIEVKSDNGYAYGVYNEQGKVIQTAGNVTIVASNGYGFYNKKGTIDITGGTIELNGSTMYGVYNEIAGTINVSGGETILMASSSYGIYNIGTMNVTGGSITSKTEDTGRGIYNTSTIDSSISNISISKTEYGIYNSQGNLTVKDIDITAKSGIRMSSSNYTIILESGDIVAKQYGIYCEYGTVEIGKKDGEISTTQPNIYGETNAVYNELIGSGVVKYYDGILAGTTAIYGGLSEIEDTTQIVSETNENNKEVVKLEKVAEEQIVAKIGNTTYSTLADAVNAASTSNEEESTEIAKLASIAGVKLGETETTEGQILIEVIADFTVSKAVEIPEGMNIKIDLAGHEIKTYAKGGITNNGTLEIVDTSSDSNAELISRIGIGITNRGTFILNGGSISSNAYGIYNYDKGNIVINEGNIIGNAHGIYSRKASNVNITINGGTVTGNTYGIYNSNNSNLIINVTDGTITGNYGISNDSSNSNTTINITDGTITGNSYGISCYSGTVNISGGTITGSNYGVNGSYINVNMTAGKVVSTSNYYSGIYTSEGKVYIYGGEVEGYNGISAGTSATVVIGKKEDNLDVNNPLIIGKNYGISVSSAKIYDGKLLGKTDAISGSIQELEDGKRIEIEETTFNNETYKIVNWIDNEVYENAIVKVGDNEYKSWKEAKEAINNIATNSTEAAEIKILNDFYMTEELEIKNGQNVTLDLNGKTITTMSKMINRGTLKITDNTSEGQGKILNVNNIGVQNSGNMAIEKGTIEAKTSGIYNYSGNLTIGVEDGNVTNVPVIKGESYGVSRNSGTISMFDGTLIGKNSSSVDKTEDEYKAYSYKEDEYYKTIIVELSPMAKIGDVETSLIEAIELAQEGDTIEILRDIQVKEKIVVPEDKNLTIDLKGHTISIKSSVTNLDAILENKGILNLVGNNGSIYNGIRTGTSIINNGTLTLNAYVRKYNSSVALINNGTLDMLGGYVESTYGITVQNNGIFNLKGGTIEIDSSSSSFAVKNNAEFNMLGGTIRTYYYGSGIKNELGSTFTMKSGSVSVDEYAIYNDSDNEINILGGSIKKSYTYGSSSYAIYNNTSADINIDGATISSGYRYGIYNNLNGNIKISNKANIYAGDANYGYGIYNNGTGNIEISEGVSIAAQNGKFQYGVYNNGSGNLIVEKSTISATGTNQAYGIVNASQGKLEITDGNINVNSDSGYAYGIQNGVLGTTTIERANIIVNTIEGKSYGINNESKNPLVVKEGLLVATGTQSTGIYSSASNIVLGNNDESITSELPVIQSDNIGIYINEVDAKFSFYDGKVIAEIPFNTGATTVEGYKIIQYYDRTEGKEVAIPVEEDNYVLTYSLMNGEKYDAFIIKAGTEITNDLMPEIEEGYEFTGWTGLPEVMPEEDVTVYAVLVPKTYTITYFVDGEEYYKQENVEYNSEILPIDVPVKEGHEFSGWEGLQEVMPAGDLEIKGVFTYIATFYNEDKTQTISQVPFTINDTAIEEPEIEEKEGYTRYWPAYELVAENIDIQLVSIENKAVINKTQGKSYDNLKSAIDEAKIDGTKDEIYLLEDINIESTITIPENTNIDIDLNGHKIINNTTYCVIENNGTLLLKNTAEEVSGIEVSKEGTNVYGIYNKNSVVVDNVEIKVESVEGYEGIGIYNEEDSTVTLGIKDEIASQAMPKITSTTYAISNEAGIFNFYDGYLIANSAINGETTETEIGHEEKVEVIENKENCYLQQVPNGTNLQATDENGITWNFTVYNKRATGLYYESGELPENLVIPSTLRGCPVTGFRGTAYTNL